MRKNFFNFTKRFYGRANIKTFFHVVQAKNFLFHFKMRSLNFLAFTLVVTILCPQKIFVVH